MCCTGLAANTGRKKSSKNRHLGTIAQLCRAISSQLRHVSTIGKKPVKQQYLLHMSLQYGEFRPTSGWDRSGSLGTPTNFNGFRVLAALLHGTPVLGVSQTLRHWTEGATYFRAGRPSRWALAHILVLYVLHVEKCDDLEENLEISLNVIIHIFVSNRHISKLAVYTYVRSC